MHRRIFTPALLLACSLVLAVSVATPRAAAQASVITDNQTVPIDFIATACNGETVTISGESHVVVHATNTPGGTSNFVTHIQFHLSGVSASGVRYNANETVNTTSTSGGNGSTTFNSVGQLNLISQGNEDNLVIRTTSHVTVNANGEITATSFEFTTDCNG
jgi:hypothetical protein